MIPTSIAITVHHSNFVRAQYIPEKRIELHLLLKRPRLWHYVCFTSGVSKTAVTKAFADLMCMHAWDENGLICMHVCMQSLLALMVDAHDWHATICDGWHDPICWPLQRQNAFTFPITAHAVLFLLPSRDCMPILTSQIPQTRPHLHFGPVN